MTPFEWAVAAFFIWAGLVFLACTVLEQCERDPEWPAPKRVSDQKKRIRSAHKDWTHRS